MMYYIFTFVISLLLIAFGLKFTEKPKSKIIGIIAIVAGIIAPCILAAFRDISVGTDTGGYVSGVFGLAKSSNSFDAFLGNVKAIYGITDILYIALNYVVAHVFNDFKIFLFITELLIVVPIFIALLRCKSKKAIVLGMLLFYLFVFNVSLNMTRQCISISFIVLMLHYLMNNRKICSAAALAIAIGFHVSSAICVVAFILYYLFKRLREKGRAIALLLTYSLIVLFVINFREIVVLLDSIGIYKHGIEYLKLYSTQFNFGLIAATTYAISVIVYLVKTHGNNGDKIERDFFCLFGVGSILLLPLSWNIRYMERISFTLFYPFLLYALPRALFFNGGKNSLSEKKISWYLTVFLVIYFMAYWFVSFVLLNSHGTVPYVFAQ